jgi:polar amino acid transport system substrate-binding protein
MTRLITPIVLLGLCFLSLPVAASQQLTIITEESPPLNFTIKGKQTGVTTEVVQEIMRRQGLSDPILVLPWARGYKRLQSEPNVVLYTTARTKEREGLFHWVGPLYAFRSVFYARKGSGLKLATVEDARRVRAIATYKEDFREQLLRSMGFTNLDSSNSPHSDILKLMSGRVDLWFFDNIGAPQVAREAGVDPSAIEEILTFEENHSYIAISQDTPSTMAAQWQATLDEMKADGTFWWITRKWLSPDAIMLGRSQKDTNGPPPLHIFTEDAAPSSYLEDGRVTGFSVEIVQELLKRIGRQDTITMVPWARGYSLALSEPDVALFSTTRLPEREDRFYWVGPLYIQTWGFYARKGSGIRISSMEEAKQVARIGTYLQDAKMQYLESLGFNNLVPTNRNITNVTHLIRGDIDLWVSSDFNMDHLVSQAGASPEQLERVFSFHEVGNYIAFSRRTSPHVVRLWQLVLDEMKNDGMYEQLCRKYNYQPK